MGTCLETLQSGRGAHPLLMECLLLPYTLRQLPLRLQRANITWDGVKMQIPVRYIWGLRPCISNKLLGHGAHRTAVGCLGPRWLQADLLVEIQTLPQGLSM